MNQPNEIIVNHSAEITYYHKINFRCSCGTLILAEESNLIDNSIEAFLRDTSMVSCHNSKCRNLYKLFSNKEGSIIATLKSN